MAEGFTKGPWEVQEIETREGGGDRYTSYGVATADGRTIMDATNSSVACIEWEHDGEPAGDVARWDSQGKADAHLIAAAPELYEALSEINRFSLVISSAVREAAGRDPRAVNQGEQVMSALINVRAALAKARGENATSSDQST